MSLKKNYKNVKLIIILIVGILLFASLGVAGFSMYNSFKQESEAKQSQESEARQDKVEKKEKIDKEKNKKAKQKNIQTFFSSKNEELIIDRPVLDKAVSCPLQIKGKISGSWFFEASFAIDIKQNNRIIETIVATTEDDWMTKEKVSFKANYDCQNCSNGPLDLIFKKENPSDIPEKDDQVLVSIKNFSCENKQTENREIKEDKEKRLSQKNLQQEQTKEVKNNKGQEMMTIDVFFAKNPESQENCKKVFAVKRTIPKTIAVARASILELLKGVNSQDFSQNYFSEIPRDVKLKSIRIANTVAYVDFSKNLNNVAGSCRVEMIESQITATLKQFPSINKVVITADGQTTLQP